MPYNLSTCPVCMNGRAMAMHRGHIISIGDKRTNCVYACAREVNRFESKEQPNKGAAMAIRARN
jgi:hypothetical protein